MLVDTHCHLDFSDNPQEWIDNAAGQNVKKLICVGTSVEASKKCIEIADSTSSVRPGSGLRGAKENIPEVYATVGIHPQDGKEDIEKYGENYIDELRKIALSSKKVVAIGEIGLDYYLASEKRVKTVDKDKEFQRKLFVDQIKLACELKLPIIVHCRNGWGEVFEIIESGKLKIENLGGVFHSWTGDLQAAKRAIDLGFYISFSGILTFKNAPQVQEVAKWVPLEKVILETDSPFLAPVPHRGEQNEPKNVKIIAQFLADLRSVSLDRIEEATCKNAEKLFKFSAHS